MVAPPPFLHGGRIVHHSADSHRGVGTRILVEICGTARFKPDGARTARTVTLENGTATSEEPSAGSRRCLRIDHDCCAVVGRRIYWRLRKARMGRFGLASSTNTDGSRPSFRSWGVAHCALHRGVSTYRRVFNERLAPCATTRAHRHSLGRFRNCSVVRASPSHSGPSRVRHHFCRCYWLWLCGGCDGISLDCGCNAFRMEFYKLSARYADGASLLKRSIPDRPIPMRSESHDCSPNLGGIRGCSIRWPPSAIRPTA